MTVANVHWLTRAESSLHTARVIVSWLEEHDYLEPASGKLETYWAVIRQHRGSISYSWIACVHHGTTQ